MSSKNEETVLDQIKDKLEKAKQDLEKIGGGAGTPGSVNSTGGPSIGSQIGWPGTSKAEHDDKKEDEKLIDKKIEEHEKEKHSLEDHQKEHDQLRDQALKAGDLDWSELTGKKE